MDTQNMIQTEQRVGQTTYTTLSLIRGGTSMAGRVTRFLTSRRREPNSLEFTYLVEQPEPDASVGDVEFEFLDDGNMLLAPSASSDECDHPNGMELDEDEEEKDQDGTREENRSFWENQHQVLQVINQHVRSSII